MLCLHAAYQNAVREQRLAQEISSANRERDFYLSRVNRAKGLAAQAERKRKVSSGNPLHAAKRLTSRTCLVQTLLVAAGGALGASSMAWPLAAWLSVLDRCPSSAS